MSPPHRPLGSQPVWPCPSAKGYVQDPLSPPKDDLLCQPRALSLPYFTPMFHVTMLTLVPAAYTRPNYTPHLWQAPHSSPLPKDSAHSALIPETWAFPRNMVGSRKTSRWPVGQTLNPGTTWPSGEHPDWKSPESTSFSPSGGSKVPPRTEVDRKS